MMRKAIFTKLSFLLFIPVLTQAQWSTTGTTVNNNGNVGINASTPLYPLHVKAYNSGSAGTYLWGQEYGTAVGVGNLSSSSYAFAVYGNFTADGNPMPGYRSLMYVRGDGNVGIGTATPGEKLTVEGNVQVNGSGRFQILDRATVQVALAPETNYTRSFFGQNLKWDFTSNKWMVLDPMYTDFAMMRLENGGDIGFYAGHSGGQTQLTNLEMGPYARMTIASNGNVAIGTNPQAAYKFAVNGSAIFTKVKVATIANWPDFVFKKDYTLMPLKELEQFITKHQHLPNVQPAAEVEKNGLDLSDNQAILLQKIEELTLYIIQQEKRIEELEKRINK